MAANETAKAKIGVLGASGYTGSELVRLLLRHPRVELVLLTADRKAGQEMAHGVSAVRAVISLPTLVSIDSIDWAKASLDLAFCALPHAHDAEGLKRSARQGAEDQGGRSVGRLPAARPGRLCAAGTATSITRRNCRRRRCTASSRSTATTIKQGAAGRQSGLLHELRPACGDAAAQGQGASSRTRSSSTPSPA